MPTFDEFYASMNPDEGTRGNEFEKTFVPWFLQTDPEWKSQIDHLWLWKDYPLRWGTDCGIDLVFRDTNGKDWAVQAKCLNPDSYITKADINSFLSESSDKRIHGRLLIATTDRIGRNARQVIERQEKQVVLFLLDNFRKSEVEFPASLQKLLQGRRKDPKTPQPHQKRAIRDVVSGLSDAARGQLIMACGTGKTLTSLWVKENLKCEATLVLVPSLSLLSQTLREWTANARVPFNWLCVCSDATVAGKDDEWVTHTSDIGVPVTGDVEEIKSFLRTEDSKVIFSTYQSSPLIAEAQKDKAIHAFDLVLADEAHRCAGKVSEAFGCVLDPKRIRTGKLLFMTATPRILSRQTKTVAEGMGIEVVSMDDPTVFGATLHELKFSQAIQEGLLSDYRVVITVVDNALIKSQIQNRQLLRTTNGVELDAETLASHIALAKATRKYDLRRVISFHGRVSGAKQFATDHQDVVSWIRKAGRPTGSIAADYVSGDMSSGDRNTKLNQLRHLEADERRLLSNARCLSEGVDVPTLDGVAFIGPRTSQVDIVQAVGRAIRKSEGKTHGTIVIPVFIDEGESEHAALETSKFKPIWDVVNALRAHDDDLAHRLDHLRVSLGRSRVIGGGGLQKIVFDLPALCGKSFADGLRTRLVEQTTASWMFWYGLLQEYVKKTGTARMRVHFKTQDGFKLGQWVSDQRKDKDVLSAERRRLLESCKGWCWDAFEVKWQHGLEELKKYVSIHGSTRVRRRFRTSDGISLSFWVFNQKRKKSSLSSEQISLLEAVEGWNWDPLLDLWGEAFERLSQYVETTGSARVPAGFRTGDGFKLASWVTTQRGSRASLSTKQRKLLESCKGWSWDPIADQWEEAFQRLKQYVETHGSAVVPQRVKTEDGFSLGSWVSNQRRRRDVLSVGQKHSLESLLGWCWDPQRDHWGEKLALFLNYVRNTGSARVPPGFTTDEGFALGLWARDQVINQESLSQDKRRLLESSCHDWSWSLLDDDWIDGFKHLQEYVKKTGAARPYRTYKTPSGFGLGQWVSDQRKNKDALSAERQKLLESCKEWSWDRFIDQWDSALARLQEYITKNGTARVPKRFINEDGFALGLWIANQRTFKDGLPAERRKRLESCKDWSWNSLVDQWSEAFRTLQQYVKANGSAMVPQRFKTHDRFPLGQWVRTQRKMKESLSTERRELLESCNGWSWNLLDDQWNEGFKRLQEYARKTGTARVPRRFKNEDGVALGSWVTTQRNRKGSLSTERRKLLESLKGWAWDARS